MKPHPTFNWQGKPSIFSELRAYNGIDTKTGELARANAKNTISLKGSNPLGKNKTKAKKK
jgi:hypothetical protein